MSILFAKDGKLLARNGVLSGGEQPCYFRQAVRCADNVPTQFFMHGQHAAALPAYKYLGICYKHGLCVPCLPDGATLITPAQVNGYQTCADCLPPVTCTRCNNQSFGVRVEVTTVPGTCCSHLPGVYDVPFLDENNGACRFIDMVNGIQKTINCPNFAPFPVKVAVSVTITLAGRISASLTTLPHPQIPNNTMYALYSGFSDNAVAAFCTGAVISFNAFAVDHPGTVCNVPQGTIAPFKVIKT